MMTDMELSLLGKNPVRGGHPTGRDTKDDAEFYELQSEVQKAVSVFNGVAADWEKIVTLASSILSEKSKDMVVAGYLAVGLIHCRGFEGFVIGSGVYMDLVDNYWADLYPAKARPIGRSRAVAWWLEKTETALKALGPVAIHTRQADALCRRLESTHAILRRDLEDCPTVRPIIEWLAGAAAPLENSPADPVAAVSAPITPAPAEAFSETQAKQTLTRLAEDARALSLFYSARDAANPLIYRLNRLSAWITIDELPVVKDGLTLLPPPEERLCHQLSDLRRRGEYEALLKSAEDEAVRYIFWLDLHRYSAEALAAMGERYAGAAETVCRETAAFLERTRGLETQAFTDGKAFADAETRNWLSRIARTPGPDKASAPEASWCTPDSSDQGHEMQEIRRLVRSRKAGDAASRFQARLSAARSVREKFIWRLEFVSALTDTPGATMIAPQIEAMLEDFDRYRMDEFDPALALRGLTIALKACRAEPGTVSRNTSEELLRRVAKIDMVEFLKQGG